MVKTLSTSAIALLFAGVAAAQSAGVITFSSNKTSANGAYEPILSWSTSPAARSCRASGGWSGTQAASGRQVIPTINATTNYSLTCDWGEGSATVRWSAPTSNTDGTALTNLARYKIRYGTNRSSLDKSVLIDDPARRSLTIHSLTTGTWYFSVRAINSANVESADSNLGSKAVSAASIAKTITISIPDPPAGRMRTVANHAWDVQKRSDGLWVRRAVVGTIALNKPCSKAFRVSSHYYVVNRSDVTLVSTPASSQLVVMCEPW
jgi:hypothetical protein